jgi:hypothetical protein
MVQTTIQRSVEGRPVWVQVTSYAGPDKPEDVKVIATDCAAPATVTDPDAGLAVYPVTEPIVYEYVPLTFVKTMDAVVEDCVLPARVTDHEVPLGRPLSVKVTSYWVGGIAVKVVATDCAAPATVTEPDAGLAVYPATAPTVYEYVPFAFVKTIVLVVEDCVLPARVTDHEVPLGRPLSVKVTSYSLGGIAVKVIEADCAEPATVTDPDAGLEVYPATDPTEYVYVPFAFVNTIVLVVEDCVLPAKVTDHEVPDGNPVSVKVTVYVAADEDVKVMGSETSAPLTTTLPDAGLAVYPATEPTVYEYVPFAFVKTMDAVVEDCVLPARVTDHEVPLGRPLSVKVTSYVAPPGPGVPAGPKRTPESTRATTMRTMTTTAPIAIHTFLDSVGFPGGEGGGEVVEDGARPGGVLELDIGWPKPCTPFALIKASVDRRHPPAARGRARCPPPSPRARRGPGQS